MPPLEVIVSVATLLAIHLALASMIFVNGRGNSVAATVSPQRLSEEQKLLELSREEIDAVAQTLTLELKRESRKALWLNIAQGAFFFLAGVGVTLLVQ